MKTMNLQGSVSNFSSLNRNFALEAVRVTEATALACSLWIGRGDQHNADQAAVNAMRSLFK